MTRVERYYRPLLIAILFFAFVTRIVRLDQPREYIFDEVYHAVTAKLIANNDLRAYEWWNPEPEPDTAVDWLHPPYAKYTQALFINIFGENTFGWRFSSVVFGVGVVWLTALLALEVFENKKLSLLAAGLASLDGLLLTQSRIAMNDIHVTFFILAALTCYVRYRKTLLLKKQKRSRFSWLLATGVTAGLALGTKWSGLFVIGVIGLWKAISWFKLALEKQPLRKKLRTLTKQGMVAFLSLIILPACLYIGAYTHMFIQGKDLAHFKELHNQIIWYQTHLEATHPFQSRPWQWFLNVRPVWFFVAYNPIGESTVANIYALGNPALFWIGDVAIIVSSFVILRLVVTSLLKKKLVFDQSMTGLSYLLSAYFLVWLPWIISPRIMFFYHYTPAVPLLCIILAFWLMRMTKTKGKWRGISQTAVIVTLGLIGLAFIIWYPNWTALPVPRWFADSVYFMIPSWK